MANNMAEPVMSTMGNLLKMPGPAMGGGGLDSITANVGPGGDWPGGGSSPAPAPVEREAAAPVVAVLAPVPVVNNVEKLPVPLPNVPASATQLNNKQETRHLPIPLAPQAPMPVNKRHVPVPQLPQAPIQVNKRPPTLPVKATYLTQVTPAQVGAVPVPANKRHLQVQQPPQAPTPVARTPVYTSRPSTTVNNVQTSAKKSWPTPVSSSSAVDQPAASCNQRQWPVQYHHVPLPANKRHLPVQEAPKGPTNHAFKRERENRNNMSFGLKEPPPMHSTANKLKTNRNMDRAGIEEALLGQERRPMLKNKQTNPYQNLLMRPHKSAGFRVPMIWSPCFHAPHCPYVSACRMPVSIAQLSRIRARYASRPAAQFPVKKCPTCLRHFRRTKEPDLPNSREKPMFVLQDHNYGAPPPLSPPRSPVNVGPPVSDPERTPWAPGSMYRPRGVDDDATSAISSERGREVEPEGEETETAPEGEGDEDAITRCICDFQHDDGYMVRCDKCFVWQHLDCMGLDRNNPPKPDDEYLCERCQPRPVERHKARTLQMRKREEIANDSSSDSSSSAFTDNDIVRHANRPSLPGMVPKKRAQTLAGGRRKSEPTNPRKVNNNITSAAKQQQQQQQQQQHRQRQQAAQAANNSKEQHAVQRRASTPGGRKNNPPAREKRTVVRRKSKAVSRPSEDETSQEDWNRPVDKLRTWIDNYEEAVTNHYSPELRAKVSSIKVNGVHSGVLGLHNVPNLVGKCTVRMIEPGIKVLQSSTNIPSNQPVIELRGKHMLATQHKPSPTLPTANVGVGGKRARPYAPFVFFYRLPKDKDDTEVCVDSRTYGNDARFVRRSCKPNSEVWHCMEKGMLHLYIVSTSAIEKNTEITIAHDKQADPPAHCVCGNPKECGVHLRNNGPQAPPPEPKADEVKERKKRRGRRTRSTSVGDRVVRPSREKPKERPSLRAAPPAPPPPPPPAPVVEPAGAKARRTLSRERRAARTPREPPPAPVAAPVPAPLPTPPVPKVTKVVKEKEKPITPPPPPPPRAVTPRPVTPVEVVAPPTRRSSNPRTPVKLDADQEDRKGAEDSEEKKAEDSKIKTREDRKIEAIMKAFERMERESKRKVDNQSKQAKRKDTPRKDSSEIKREQEPVLQPPPAPVCNERSKKRRRKGRGRTNSAAAAPSSAPKRRRTRFNSGRSDTDSNDGDDNKMGPPFTSPSVSSAAGLLMALSQPNNNNNNGHCYPADKGANSESDSSDWDEETPPVSDSSLTTAHKTASIHPKDVRNHKKPCVVNNGRMNGRIARLSPPCRNRVQFTCAKTKRKRGSLLHVMSTVRRRSLVARSRWEDQYSTSSEEETKGAVGGRGWGLEGRQEPSRARRKSRVPVRMPQTLAYYTSESSEEREPEGRNGYWKPGDAPKARFNANGLDGRRNGVMEDVYEDEDDSIHDYDTYHESLESSTSSGSEEEDSMDGGERSGPDHKTYGRARHPQPPPEDATNPPVESTTVHTEVTDKLQTPSPPPGGGVPSQFDSGCSSSSSHSSVTPTLSSACLLVAAAVGPLAPGFKFPKTKKGLMNEWLNKSPDFPPTPSPTLSHPYPPIGSEEGFPFNKSLDTLAQAAIATSPNKENHGSAKKRWLRQVMSQEGDGSGSPNSRAGSPPCADYVTPLKKRRVARESQSSEHSFTPPTTPTEQGSPNDGSGKANAKTPEEDDPATSPDERNEEDEEEVGRKSPSADKSSRSTRPSDETASDRGSDSECRSEAPRGTCEIVSVSNTPSLSRADSPQGVDSESISAAQLVQMQRDIRKQLARGADKTDEECSGANSVVKVEKTEPVASDFQCETTLRESRATWANDSDCLEADGKSVVRTVLDAVNEKFKLEESVDDAQKADVIASVNCKVSTSVNSALELDSKMEMMFKTERDQESTKKESEALKVEQAKEEAKIAKRKLSISEYRQRKQLDPPTGPSEPTSLNVSPTPRVRSNSSSSSSGSSSSLSDDESPPNKPTLLPDLPAFLPPPYADPADDKKGLGEERGNKFDHAPTLVERQRENLMQRLRREFGLFLGDETDASKQPGVVLDPLVDIDEKRRGLPPPPSPLDSSLPPRGTFPFQSKPSANYSSTTSYTLNNNVNYISTITGNRPNSTSSYPGSNRCPPTVPSRYSNFNSTGLPYSMTGNFHSAPPPTVLPREVPGPLARGNKPFHTVAAAKAYFPHNNLHDRE